jgi:hypothetical protein
LTITAVGNADENVRRNAAEVPGADRASMAAPNQRHGKGAIARCRRGRNTLRAAWSTLLGTVIGGKLWDIDRMVWLYEDMTATHADLRYRDRPGQSP